jgi:AAA+ superfamily predicted ATPase
VSTIEETSEFFSQVDDSFFRESASRAEPQQSLLNTATQQAATPGEIVQWMLLPNGKFAGNVPTTRNLEPGAYRPQWDDRYGVVVERRHVKTDNIVEFPDAASDAVLRSIQMFWERKDIFLRNGHLFKRGIMLWGPPGSGKTITINLVMRDLIKRGGIVVLVQSPELATATLELIRKLEPERPVICVLEDIDEIIREYREHTLLALLDGENQVGNVVHLATTNYPELLPSRLVNRPSRFDEVIKIGMPSDEARKIYILSRLSEAQLFELALPEIHHWIKDTRDMSIAHLRELIVAVTCLGREYKETIDRLKAMKQTPKGSSEKAIGMV